MRRKVHTTLVVATVISGALGLAPVVEAASISYDGAGVLIYTGGGENNDQTVGTTADDKGSGVVLAFGASEVGANYAARATANDQGCYVDEFDSDFLECTFSSQAGVRFSGGDGDDNLYINLEGASGPVPVAMNGEGGADTLKVGDKALATLDGGAGADKLYGDHITAAPDKLLGGPDSDELRGYGGADELRGGEGDDIFQAPGSGARSPDVGDGAADILDGGPGRDVLNFLGTSPVTVTQDGVADDGSPGESENITAIEVMESNSSGTFHGTPANDDIYASVNIGVGQSTVYGHDGNDLLRGRDEKETLDGGAGDDTLLGGFNDDTLIGGPGRDTLKSDVGDPFCASPSACTPPTGNDRIEARDGEVDSIDCGPGSDTVIADAVDTIAESCETVDRGAGTGGGGGGGGGGTASGDTTPPVFGAAAIVAGQSLRTLVKTGALRVRTSLDERATLRAELFVDVKAARSLGLTKRRRGKPIRIGTGSVTAGPGNVVVSVKLTAKARRAIKRKLRRLRRISLTVQLEAVSPGGTATKSLGVRLRR